VFIDQHKKADRVGIGVMRGVRKGLLVRPLTAPRARHNLLRISLHAIPLKAGFSGHPLGLLTLKASLPVLSMPAQAEEFGGGSLEHDTALVSAGEIPQHVSVDVLNVLGRIQCYRSSARHTTRPPGPAR
jgi:hypothetical protein